jgi:hypothetical protein
MGFFDAVKDKAGALAADTQRAGKVTAAQARLVVLQSDLKKAERELGHAAFALAERGEIAHPDLAPAVERLRSTSAEVRSKEAEIAALRGEAHRAQETAALTPADSQMEAATAAPVTVAAATPAATPDEPAGEDAARETPTAQAPAKKSKPAVRKTAAKAATPKPAAKKPATKKVAAKRTPAKKAAAPKAVPAATPRSQPKAGATPKKSSRPSSSRPRPAGKKRPAGS